MEAKWSTQGLDDAEEAARLRAVVQNIAYMASLKKTVRSEDIIQVIEVGANNLLPGTPTVVITHEDAPAIPMVAASMYDHVLEGRNLLRRALRAQGKDPVAIEKELREAAAAQARAEYLATFPK